MTDNLLTPEDSLEQPTVTYDELLKKYKDNEGITKKVVHADATIEILKRQLDQMREDYTKARDENMTKAKLEDLIDKLSKPASSEITPANEEIRKPAFDPNELDSLVSNKIREHESSKTQQENFNSVRDKLKERFGANYQSTVKQHIEDLGLTEEYFNDLARRTPKALYKILGMDSTSNQNYSAPPRSSSGYTPQPQQKRTWSYYQELKKSNPNLFFDQKTNIQMSKDMVELGEAFKDGDFYKFGPQ